ncbi:conserved hypothetical protein [Streptococcus intermedius JTH08]|nr:conserved hypothetical protein [Streptococcus intermedius JTH08]
MWGILRATQQRIFSVATNVRKAIMSFIQWGGMLLDFQQNNTQWIQEMTQLNLQLKTLPTLNVKSIALVSHMIGIAKLTQQILTTISGRSGFLQNCMKKVWHTKLKCQLTGLKN